MTESSTAKLTIDVDAVVANHRLIADRVGPNATAAAVVKADAYGLGVARIARRLWRSGCREFFVARLDEGLALREQLSEATIHVFDGVTPGSAAEFARSDLVPVINSLPQLERWRSEAKRLGDTLPTVIHVDTGMLRLGLDNGEFTRLVERPELLDGLTVTTVASHVASADEADSEQPEQQLERFTWVRKGLPMGRASLANSAGVFRHADYHFDLVRPGYALYGGHPQPDTGPNPMQPVVTLDAPVLQLRRGEAGETVGYGASHTLDRPSLLATIGIGYADGFLRAGSGRGAVAIGEHLAPILGRISMDLITVDVTDLPADSVGEGAWVEVIGPHRPIDDVAADAGTIGYEILTALGGRYRRRYVDSSLDEP
ncbi:MAG: alanine racemase [Acidimicrobiia bacterium]|nr:alanine racemase [Acidimicrobiia bacterium]